MKEVVMVKIDELFEEMMNNRPLLVNPYYLTDAYIPENLLFRDDEMKAIIIHASDFLFHSIPKNVVVHGPPGVGKTVAMKLLVTKFNDFAKRNNISAQAIYIPVKDLSYYKTLYTIGIEIGAEVKKGMSLADLQAVIVKTLRETQKRYLIILDEVDKMHKNARTSKEPFDDVIYTTSRINERTGQVSVSLFIVTNNARMIDELSAPSYSSLAPVFIYFRDYTVDELREILSDRVQKAFVPNAIDDSIIARLAALIRRDSRDLRWAFQVLRIVPMYQEDGRITEHSISEAIKAVDKSVIEQIIKNLDVDYLITLLAAATLRRVGEHNRITSSDLYNEYKKLSESYGWKPKTMKHIIHYITPKLESLGLLSRTVVSRGRYGRSYVFSPEERGPEFEDIVKKHIKNKIYMFSRIS